MGWGGAALVWVCIIFLVLIASIATWALWRWSNGAPIDLGGFAALLGQASLAGAAVWSLAKNYIFTRRDERVEEIRAGQSAPPFPPAPISVPPSTAPPEPMPGGGLVNPESLQ
jgi:hypothetical protein